MKAKKSLFFGGGGAGGSKANPPHVLSGPLSPAAAHTTSPLSLPGYWGAQQCPQHQVEFSCTIRCPLPYCLQKQGQNGWCSGCPHYIYNAFISWKLSGGFFVCFQLWTLKNGHCGPADMVKCPNKSPSTLYCKNSVSLTTSACDTSIQMLHSPRAQRPVRAGKMIWSILDVCACCLGDAAD